MFEPVGLLCEPLPEPAIQPLCCFPVPSQSKHFPGGEYIESSSPTPVPLQNGHFLVAMLCV